METALVPNVPRQLSRRCTSVFTRAYSADQASGDGYRSERSHMAVPVFFVTEFACGTSASSAAGISRAQKKKRARAKKGIVHPGGDIQIRRPRRVPEALLSGAQSKQAMPARGDSVSVIR